MSDKGPAEFTAEDIDLTGPFRAVGSVTTWHFSGDVDTGVGEYFVEFAAEKRTLTLLVNEGGIGIYCISNRCRSRYLKHPSNRPTLVATIVGIGHANGAHYVGLVALEKPRRNSSKRLSGGSGVGRDLRRWSDLANPHGSSAADFACPRCRADGRVAPHATAQSGTM